MKEMKQKFTQFIHIAIITILMTSCASGKIVLSNDANIRSTNMSFSVRKHLGIEN